MNSVYPFLAFLVCPIAMGVIMFLMMRGRRDGSADIARSTAPEGAGRPRRAVPAVRFVRNLRAERITIVAAGAHLDIAPHGEPGDLIALPAAILQDPDLRGYIHLGWIEEVPKREARQRMYASSVPGRSPNGRDQAAEQPDETG